MTLLFFLEFLSEMMVINQGVLLLESHRGEVGAMSQNDKIIYCLGCGLGLVSIMHA